MVSTRYLFSYLYHWASTEAAKKENTHVGERLRAGGWAGGQAAGDGATPRGIGRGWGHSMRDRWGMGPLHAGSAGDGTTPCGTGGGWGHSTRDRRGMGPLYAGSAGDAALTFAPTLCGALHPHIVHLLQHLHDLHRLLSGEQVIRHVGPERHRLIQSLVEGDPHPGLVAGRRGGRN